MKKCILIYGMHRSGTSTLAGLLKILGIDLGKELLDAKKENPKGFFENKKIYQLNEEILNTIELSWHQLNLYQSECSYIPVKFKPKFKSIIRQEFCSGEIFAIKDPRLALLGSFYETCLNELNFNINRLYIDRDNLEVARSINKRNNFKLSYGYALSLAYKRKIEDTINGKSCYNLKFDKLLSEPVKVLRNICDELSLPYNLSDPILQNEIYSFVDPGISEHTSNEFEVLYKMYYYVLAESRLALKKIKFNE